MDKLTEIEIQYKCIGESAAHAVFVTKNETVQADTYLLPKEQWERMHTPAYIRVRVIPINHLGQQI